MNIKHILRKDGENDIKLRARIKKEHQIADLSKTIERLKEQKQKVIALIKDGRFVEALQELENETLA